MSDSTALVLDGSRRAPKRRAVRKTSWETGGRAFGTFEEHRARAPLAGDLKWEDLFLPPAYYRGRAIRAVQADAEWGRLGATQSERLPESAVIQHQRMLRNLGAEWALEAGVLPPSKPSHVLIHSSTRMPSETDSDPFWWFKRGIFGVAMLLGVSALLLAFGLRLASLAGLCLALGTWGGTILVDNVKRGETDASQDPRVGVLLIVTCLGGLLTVLVKALT